MATENEKLTVAELRRRRKAREALDNAVKNLADALVVDTRRETEELARVKQAADERAATALAVAASLFGGADDLAELTGIPAKEIERAVKATSSAHVKEALAELRERASEKLRQAEERRQTRRGNTARTASESGTAVSTIEPSEGGASTSTAAGVPHPATATDSAPTDTASA